MIQKFLHCKTIHIKNQSLYKMILKKNLIIYGNTEFLKIRIQRQIVNNCFMIHVGYDAETHTFLMVSWLMSEKISRKFAA